MLMRQVVSLIPTGGNNKKQAKRSVKFSRKCLNGTKRLPGLCLPFLLFAGYSVTLNTLMIIMPLRHDSFDYIFYILHIYVECNLYKYILYRNINKHYKILYKSTFHRFLRLSYYICLKRCKWYSIVGRMGFMANRRELK